MTYPMRTLAGIHIPNTPLITAALAYANVYSTPYAYNHVVRSWLFGLIILRKLPRISSAVDLEVHAVAAILHDLGWDPTGTLVSSDKRFEVDGANAAREFLKKNTSPLWEERKVQLVWDAIALHTTGSIVFHKEPEVVACAYGIWADFQGPDRIAGASPGTLLTWEEYRAVVKEFPRLDLMNGLKEVMCGLCRTKPETTYDNTVGEWGDKFVEGYSREGKLTADLLLTCDLDEREREPKEILEGDAVKKKMLIFSCTNSEQRLNRCIKENSLHE